MCLYHESRSNIKRHGRDIGKGRRLDHLTQVELKIVTRDTNATHRLTMRSLWWHKTTVSTLSIRTRSLRENLFESAGRKDAFRFCKDACEAHKKGKLQVRYEFWKFVQDIFHNLVHSKSWRMYSACT